jgi:MarR family transcriptional regulator for hemolysin
MLTNKHANKEAPTLTSTMPPLLGALLRVVRDLRAQYDESAREIGLTLARARVLTALLPLEHATQAELAAAIGIEPPTLKRHIDALEAEGYLERRAHPGDVRKRAIYLTERARNAKTVLLVQRLRSDLLEGISEEEQNIVCDVLDRITKNAGKLAKS